MSIMVAPSQVGFRGRSGSGSGTRSRSGSWNTNELLNPLTVLNSADGAKAAAQLAANFTVNPFPNVVMRRRSSIDTDLHKAHKLNDLLNELLGPVKPQQQHGGEQQQIDGHCGDNKHDSKGHLVWRSDYAADTWEWPLHGEMKVKSTEHEFEVTFDFRPFLADEVEAHVLCTDLTVRCRRGADRTPVDIKGDQCVREIIRTYSLPGNVDPQSVRFFLKAKEGKLRVTAEKIPPLKMNVAAYLEIADVHRLKDGLPLVDIVRLKHLRDGGASVEQLTKELERCLAKSRLAEKQKTPQGEPDLPQPVGSSCATEAKNLLSHVAQAQVDKTIGVA